MIDAGRDTVAGSLTAVRIARREARRSRGRSALAVTLIGLPVLAGALAFAVGARRRQHELAQGAAGGGTPAQLRRIVLAEWLVLGAFAAADRRPPQVTDRGRRTACTDG